jgi:broad specificity phosphatase PhoE
MNQDERYAKEQQLLAKLESAHADLLGTFREVLTDQELNAALSWSRAMDVLAVVMVQINEPTARLRLFQLDRLRGMQIEEKRERADQWRDSFRHYATAAVREIICQYSMDEESTRKIAERASKIALAMMDQEDRLIADYRHLEKK